MTKNKNDDIKYWQEKWHKKNQLKARKGNSGMVKPSEFCCVIACSVFVYKKYTLKNILELEKDSVQDTTNFWDSWILSVSQGLSLLEYLNSSETCIQYICHDPLRHKINSKILIKGLFLSHSLKVK